MNPAWRLESAEDRHRGAPRYFFVPPLVDRESIAVGEVAKLLFADGDVGERIWVEVTARNSRSYHGVLRDAPEAIPDLRKGAVGRR